MKLGVYGGTFNPIHLGHIHILKEFITRLNLDRVLLIPTGTPPHKAASSLASAEDRMAMCDLAVKEITEAPMEVSRMEIEREGKSYTVLTLLDLHSAYPDDELYFLMGEDMFLTLDKWYHPEAICNLAVLCASPRSAAGLKSLKLKQAELERSFNARCHVENISYLPVSSTQVRELAAGGESFSQLVPASVEEYIRSHGLYIAAGEDME